MAKTYTVDYFKDRKLKWEKNHGKFIHEFMFNEYQARILGQCNTALNDLQRQLDLEIARAKAEEARIEAKAHNELEKVYNSNRLREASFDTVISSDNNDNVDDIGYNYLEYNNLHQLVFYRNEHKYLGDAYKETFHAVQSAYNNINLNKANVTDINKLLRIVNVSTANNINDVQNDKTIYPYASWKSDTNELETTTPNTANKTLPNALSDSYNAIAQAHHAVNNLYMVNNTDGYTLNDEGKLVKNDQQTKLISNYNDTIMYITQALNQLRFDHDSLVTRVSLLENNHE